MRLRLAAFVSLLLCSLVIAAHSAEVTVAPLEPPQLWNRAEFRVHGLPAAANNFDPEQIRVDALVTAPDRQTFTVPVFWYQGFSRTRENGGEKLTPAGAGEWRIRFTPTQAGEYTVAVSFQAGEQRGQTEATRFSVAPAATKRQHGWVKIAPDRRSFETSDSRALRLIGENVCWGEGQGTYDFDKWFEAMAASGQNFARIWLCPWSMNFEHTPGTLNRYNQEAAWALDHVFQLAEEKDIYLMICFDHHGMYQVDNRNWGGSNNFWRTNPYNRVSGGPCAGPNDFFTDPVAQTIYQKRLRYLVGRYAYSERLLAWQFFNEIDNVYAPVQSLNAADVASWHSRMGQWLRANDAFHHLVTTSLTGGSDRADIWSLPEMDFAMYHSYQDPAPARKLPNLAEDFLRRYGKPVMVGEFGVSARDWSIVTDPHLRGFRQALWSSAVGGTVGTAMSWWWEDIHNHEAYTIYSAMREILNTAGWNEGSWTPVAIADQEPLPIDVGEPLADGKAFNATLPLCSFWRNTVRGELALTDPLAAERASEYLSSYLHGVKRPELGGPIKITAHFGREAKLAYRVNSVAADVEVVVRVDGAEIQRTRLFDRDGLATVNREIDRELAVDVPAGKHTVEIANTGLDWLYLDQIRVENVRPAAYPNGKHYAVEASGTRSAATGRAVLYVHSPYVVYPAGALRYQPPVQSGKTLKLLNWPAGNYVAKWYNTLTGKLVGTTTAQSSSTQLNLPIPDFREDLVAIVAP